MSQYRISICVSLHDKNHYYIVIHEPLVKKIRRLHDKNSVWLGIFKARPVDIIKFRNDKKNKKFTSFDECLTFIKFYFPDIKEEAQPSNYPSNDQIIHAMEKFYDDAKVPVGLRFTNLLHFAYFRFYEIIGLNTVENLIRITRYYFIKPTLIDRNEKSLGVFLIRNMQFSEFYDSLPFTEENKVVIGEHTYYSISREILEDLCDAQWALSQIKQIFTRKLSEQLDNNLPTIFVDIKSQEITETHSERTLTPIKPIPLKNPPLIITTPLGTD